MPKKLESKFIPEIYEKYKNGKSLKELALEYKTAIRTLKSYFKALNYQLKTKEEIIKERKEKAESTSLIKYGVKNIFSLKSTQEKIKETNIKNLGVNNPSKSQEIKLKKENTCFRNLGVKYPTQSDKVKEKCKNAILNKTSEEQEVTRNKRKKTNIDKYGYEQVLASKIIRGKIKDFYQKNYGVDYNSQVEEIKLKKKNTFLSKYGVSTPLILESTKNKVIETNLNNYDVRYPFESEEYREKIFKTIDRKILEEKKSASCKLKYGYNSPLESPKIKEHIKQTNIKNLGVENPFQSEIIKQKIKDTKSLIDPQIVRDKTEKTCKEKLGYKTPFESPVVQEKIKHTLKNRYNVSHPSYSKEIIDKIKDTWHKKIVKTLIPFLLSYNYEFLDDYKGSIEYNDSGDYVKHRQYKIRHTSCNHIFYDDIFSLPRCPICFPNINSSQEENIFREYIENLTKEKFNSNKSIIRNPHTNRFLEIDIYNEKCKIAFEYNGLYRHKAKLKNYHKLKTELCLKESIKLYHIWSFHNPNIIQSKINNIFNFTNKIYARKLIFKEIKDKEITHNFLKQNHLYGSSKNILSFGLFSQENLISIMTFRKIPNNTDKLEIARYCTLLNNSVIGGFNKLFKNSIKIIKEKFPYVTQIITYADKDWSPKYDEVIYYKNGFDFLRDTGPSMFYVVGNKIYSRQKFQKHKLKKIFPDIYNESLTEKQMLSIKDIFPIYTSGNWKFKKDI